MHGLIDKSLRIKPVEVEDFLGKYYRPVSEESLEYIYLRYHKKNHPTDQSQPMIRENQQLVTDEPVEFEK
jgi:hypothetical protein